MSGRVLGLLSIHRLRWLMRGLQVLGFRATRIDLVLDDFGWGYTPRDPYSEGVGSLKPPSFKRGIQATQGALAPCTC
jgi:hypothetical protein